MTESLRAPWGVSSLIMICFIIAMGASILRTMAVIARIAGYVQTEWSRASHQVSVKSLESQEKWIPLTIPSEEEYSSGDKAVEQ